MSCTEIQSQIHDYLDGELSHQEESRFKEHLNTCAKCHQHLLELEKTIALVQSLSHVRTTRDFTEKLLARLPKEKKRQVFAFWMKKHPLVVAASIFILFMFGSSIFSWYGEDRELQISSNALASHSLIVEDGYVYVPEDKVIEGDLIVKHGNIKVSGIVKGNVIAIDGKVLLSSTAHIAGKTEEVNQLLDWIWYKIKSFGDRKSVV